MPRSAEPEELTPFALVLADYMWNKRPPNRRPMTPPQLAAKLNVPRQSVNNWIYRGNVPPLEAVLAILAQLDIPMRALFDAYKQAGLSVPRWDYADEGQPQIVPGKTVAERTKKQTTLPTESMQVPRPKPYIPPAKPYDPEAAEAEEWDRMIAQAQAVMRAEGASPEVVEAVARHMRSQQHPETDPMRQHIIAEHSEPTKTDEQPDKQPRQPKQPNTQQQRQHTRK